MNNPNNYYALKGQYFNLDLEEKIESFDEKEVVNHAHELHLVPQQLRCSRDGSAELAVNADGVESHILDMVYGSKVRGGMQFHDGVLTFTPAQRNKTPLMPKIQLQDWSITSFPRETRFSISFENGIDLDAISARLLTAVERLQEQLPLLVEYMNRQDKRELAKRFQEQRRQVMLESDALALQRILEPKAEA